LAFCVGASPGTDALSSVDAAHVPLADTFPMWGRMASCAAVD
jgi:hypothetical protein